MKKKSIIMILVIIVSIGMLLLISFEKNQVEETTNINTVTNKDNLTTAKDTFETEDDNKGYDILRLDELSDTDKFMNTGYIISMKVFLRINQIL